jgi:hypothetical protein
VRPWFAKAGSHGLLGLIERLNEGDELEAVYSTANIAIEMDAPHAATPLAARPSP